MALRDFFRPRRAQTTRAEPTLKAGRPSQQVNRQRLTGWSYQGLIPRESTRDWNVRAGTTVLATLRTVCDRDPDASQALNNLLLFMGRGYTTEAYKPGTDTLDAKATAYLRAWDAAVGSEYGGGMDALIDVVNITLISQGAIGAELELNDDLTEVVDFHPIDPGRIVMKREDGSGRLLRGVQGQPGKDGADREGFLELSPRQFRYVPLHPWVDDPYGRSLFLASLTAIFFKVQVLQDLEAVVHNQGYPRLDVKVLQEAVYANAPANLKTPGREAELAQYAAEILASIQEAYNSLNPDDTFIHFDNVEVGYTGPPGGGAINFDTLRSILDTQIIAGLKQLPSFLGRNEGSSTTHATVQYRVFVYLIEALQRRTKRLIEWGQTTALQVAGYQAVARVTFEEPPTSERLTDAQALEAETRAHETAVRNGWEDDDQAATEIFGHKATGQRQADDPPVEPDAERVGEALRNLQGLIERQATQRLEPAPVPPVQIYLPGPARRQVVDKLLKHDASGRLIGVTETHTEDD